MNALVKATSDSQNLLPFALSLEFSARCHPAILVGGAIAGAAQASFQNVVRKATTVHDARDQTLDGGSQ